MNLKIPYSDPTKFDWPPPQIPISVQVVSSTVFPAGPTRDANGGYLWHGDIAKRTPNAPQAASACMTITSVSKRIAKQEKQQKRKPHARLVRGSHEFSSPRGFRLVVRVKGRAGSTALR